MSDTFFRGTKMARYGYQAGRDYQSTRSRHPYVLGHSCNEFFHLSPIYTTEIFGTARIKVARVPKAWQGISCLHVLYSAVPITAKSNFGTAKLNLGSSWGLSFLVRQLETTAVCMRSISNMTEEQYLEYLS